MPESDEGQLDRSARCSRSGADRTHRLLQGGAYQGVGGAWRARSQYARGHLLEARVRLDNTIRHAEPDHKCGAQAAARARCSSCGCGRWRPSPGLGEAVVLLLGVRRRLIEQIAQLGWGLKTISLSLPACQLLMGSPGQACRPRPRSLPPRTTPAGSRDREPLAPYFGLVRTPPLVRRVQLDPAYHQAGRQHRPQGPLRGGKLDDDANEPELRAQNLSAPHRQAPGPASFVALRKMRAKTSLNVGSPAT